MPVYQQVADLAVGGDACFVAAGFEIGVIDGVGKVGGCLIPMIDEESVVILRDADARIAVVAIATWNIGREL